MDFSNLTENDKKLILLSINLAKTICGSDNNADLLKILEANEKAVEVKTGVHEKLKDDEKLIKTLTTSIFDEVSSFSYIKENYSDLSPC